jgi:hypothetical protein
LPVQLVQFRQVGYQRRRRDEADPWYAIDPFGCFGPDPIGLDRLADLFLERLDLGL